MRQRLTILAVGIALGLAARLFVQAYVAIIAEVAPAPAAPSPGQK